MDLKTATDLTDPLLSMFALRHSVNGYIQVFRGSKLLLTSEMENAYRDYQKHFPIVERLLVQGFLSDRNRVGYRPSKRLIRHHCISSFR